MISSFTWIVSPIFLNSSCKEIALLLSLWVNLLTPLIFVWPSQQDARAVNGGNRSGQSVASNSKAFMELEGRIFIPFASTAMFACALLNASMMALSAWADAISKPLMVMGPAMAPATNRNAPPLQSPSTAYVISDFAPDNDRDRVSDLKKNSSYFLFSGTFNPNCFITLSVRSM